VPKLSHDPDKSVPPSRNSSEAIVPPSNLNRSSSAKTSTKSSPRSTSRLGSHENLPGIEDEKGDHTISKRLTSLHRRFLSRPESTSVELSGILLLTSFSTLFVIIC